MATSQLVRSEIEAGLELVRVLDRAKLGIVAALWLYSSDTETWRFVLAVDEDSKGVSGKYLAAARAISTWLEDHPNQAPVLDLSRVRFLSASDPLITGLSKFVRMDGLGEVRASNNIVNGVYVEDALIHRLAA